MSILRVDRCNFPLIDGGLVVDDTLRTKLMELVSIKGLSRVYGFSRVVFQLVLFVDQRAKDCQSKFEIVDSLVLDTFTLLTLNKYYVYLYSLIVDIKLCITVA